MKKVKQVKDDRATKATMPDDVHPLSNSFGKCIVFPHDEKQTPRSISNLESLSKNLPLVSSVIFNHLGSQENEATYQRCLKIDLEEAGVKVEEEVEIPLMYKGQQVGSRRADLVLEMTSGEKAVIEVKAVSEMNNNHMDQLKFYMHYLNIDRGYLINFPHDAGYIRSFRLNVAYCAKILLGRVEDYLFHDNNIPRLRNDPKTTSTRVQVMEVNQREMHHEEKILRHKSHLSKPSATQWGITQQGRPCKICIQIQDFCKYHKSQRTNRFF